MISIFYLKVLCAFNWNIYIFQSQSKILEEKSKFQSTRRKVCPTLARYKDVNLFLRNFPHLTINWVMEKKVSCLAETEPSASQVRARAMGTMSRTLHFARAHQSEEQLWGSNLFWKIKSWLRLVSIPIQKPKSLDNFSSFYYRLSFVLLSL